MGARSFNARPLRAKKKEPLGFVFEHKKNLANSYFCRGRPQTIVGSDVLNFRVRDGNGCDHIDIFTRNVLYIDFSIHIEKYI